MFCHISVHNLPRLDLTNENCFTLKKVKKHIIPGEANYADDIAFLVNTPTQAESLLLSLEQAAGGVGLFVNADKTEYICFNQKGHISTLNGDSLKFVDKFTYLGNSVSFTENDSNERRAKAWTAIDRLSIIWK